MASEHRLQVRTTVLDVARDSVRVHLRCVGCDLTGSFDIAPANAADRLIAVMAAGHNTLDLFAAAAPGGPGRGETDEQAGGAA